jgi:hypothetical protein
LCGQAYALAELFHPKSNCGQTPSEAPETPVAVPHSSNNQVQES